MTEPRMDLIKHIRQQIEEGRYATPKRLELTAERLRECLTSGSESITVVPADGADGEHNGEEGSQSGQA